MKKNSYCEISVIVPVYNVEKYINKCLDSILNQTFKNFEVILIDDGSTDLSGKICDEYLKKDDRVKVIHKENGGLSSARNAGIDISNGKYITFIDSDDYINENYINILYDNIIYNNADISICKYKKFKFDKEDIEYTLTKDISILDSHQSLEKLYDKHRQIYVIACAKLYKKELFDKVMFPIGKINEDSFTLYKLYLNSKIIVYNDSELYFYRDTEGSIMNKKFTYKNFDDLEAFEEQINFYIENKYYELEKKAIHRYCYHLKEFYIRFKRDNTDKKGLKIVKQKHKNIKKYVKGKGYYTIEEKDFIKAPWCYEKLIEPYWFLIAIKNKIIRIVK